jgi:hypothetical protein
LLFAVQGLFVLMVWKPRTRARANGIRRATFVRTARRQLGPAIVLAVIGAFCARFTALRA